MTLFLNPNLLYPPLISQDLARLPRSFITFITVDKYDPDDYVNNVVVARFARHPLMEQKWHKLSHLILDIEGVDNVLTFFDE